MSQEAEIASLKNEINAMSAELVRQEADLIENRFALVKRTRSLQIFQELYERILSAKDHAEVYQVTAHLLHDVGYDRVAIFRKEGNVYIPIASNGYTSKEKSEQLPSPSFSTLVEQQEGVLVNGENCDSFGYDYQEELDVKFFIAVHFYLDPSSRISHILLAGNKTEVTVRRPRLTLTDLQILKTLTNQISMAVEKIGFVERLQASEQKYRMLYENSIEGFFQIAPSGSFLSVNPTMARLLGYQKAETLLAENRNVGKDFFVIPEEFTTICKRAEVFGRVLGVETRIKTRDGLMLWVAVSARWVKNEQEEVQYWEGTIVDITEKIIAKEMEMARKAAETANQAKSQFLANMSHEIRTPMNGVIGMAELLLHTKLDDTQRFYADTVQTCGRSLLKIVNNILDFSKVEAGKLELEHIDFDLRELLEGLIDMMNTNAEEKGIELLCNVAPDVNSAVTGDPGRLRQILLNLLSNALKFTDGGQVIVFVANTSQNEQQVGLRFIVRDTGIGIPPDKQDLLFDSFTQVDSSNTRMFGGSGLGLAICRQLVKLMGGEIGVKSKGKEGSEFWFTVKLGKQQIVSTPVLDSPICRAGETCIAMSSSWGARGNAQLLLVEDNLINQQVVCGILAKLGINNVDIAEHGAEALAMMGKHYDLILMDIQMPVMDGIETTKRIRANVKQANASELPIIALTAHALKSDHERCLKAGMNDFITKPILPEILEKILQKWLLRPSDPAPRIRPAQQEECHNQVCAGEQSVVVAEAITETVTPNEDDWKYTPVFDYHALKQRTMGDDRIAKEIIQVYWSRLPNQLGELKSLDSAGDNVQVVRLAHSLKGSSGSVGAMQLFLLFSALEHAAEKGEPLQKQLVILEHRSREFEAVLRQYNFI